METGTSTDNIIEFEPIEIDPNSTEPVKMRQVIRCQWGHKHTLDTWEDHEAYLRHSCAHEGGFVAIFGDPGSLACLECGAHYGIHDPAARHGQYLCPVCYWTLQEEPTSGDCPCCGTGFRLDLDILAAKTAWCMEQPRPRWKGAGPEPEHWNPWLQLAHWYRKEGVKQIVRLTQEEMRDKWKELGMDERIASGELRKESFDLPPTLED